MWKSKFNIIANKLRKSKKFCVLGVVGIIIIVYIQLIRLDVAKVMIFQPSNLKFVVLDQRNGITKEIFNRLEHRKNTLWKYQASCHVHMWHELCGTRIESLLTYPIFPHLPTLKSKAEKIDFHDLEDNTGFRIYGFLRVPLTSNYQLQVETSHINMLFWLSKTDLPNDMDLIFNATIVEKHLYSNIITLESEKNYFFDIVLKVGNLKGSISLYIKDTSKSEFELVDKRFLQTHDSNQSDVMEIDKLYTSKSANLTITRNSKPLWALEQNKGNIKRSNSYKISLMPQQLIQQTLPSCEYEPSYLIRKKLRYKSGVWETRYISIYPADYTNQLHRHEDTGVLQVSYGNDILDKEIAESISGDVMRAINAKLDRAFQLKNIVNVERVRDPLKGDRFLVELEVLEPKTDELSLISKFVYRTNSRWLCEPSGFESNRKVHVNIIVTAKNQGRWLQHLLNTFSEIYQSTGDKDYTLIIVDFNSGDIDLIIALQNSFIPNYILLNHDGRFYKTLGIQVAADKVSNPNEIILLLDLHLTIPLDFLHVARKHTVQGKTAFCPSVFRLQCGSTPEYPNGSWEVGGYGIFSVYKSDWDIFGGMNVKDFYNRWGGEDWDMLDRFLSAGYEVERLKLKNFNHIFHTKAGMWHKSS